MKTDNYRAKRLVSLLFLTLFSCSLMGQQQRFDSFPDSLNKKRFYTVAGSGTTMYVGGLSYLGFVWYKDQERVPFHWYNDGRAYLQMDKAAHAYIAYQESYLAYRALRWTGVEKRKALLWGASAGFLFQLPIEIFDGLYEGWGFSWWDVAANSAGAALFAVQEALWEAQHVVMKISYAPSVYPTYHHILGENHLERFTLDYNGHTYWFSGNLRSISSIEAIPAWLNLAVGYSANGMIHEYTNPEWYRGKPFPHLERYRQFFISLDADLTKIPSRKPWVRGLLQALNMVKIPFPALEYNRVDGLQFRAFYF